LRLSERAGWGFNESSISKTSLIQLCRRLDDHGGTIKLLELGGGQSTLFWWALRSLELLQVEVTTLVHEAEWAKELQHRVETEKNFKVISQTLRQITDEELEFMLSNPMDAASIWASTGSVVPRHAWYKVRNCFYGEANRIGLSPQSIDVVVVGGPQTNGRSLACLLLCRELKPDAFVLVDQFDEYPFLHDLGRVFRFEEMYREVIGGKRSVLLRLQGMRTGVCVG
jgi:hypothetical protein